MYPNDPMLSFWSLASKQCHGRHSFHCMWINIVGWAPSHRDFRNRLSTFLPPPPWAAQQKTWLRTARSLSALSKKVWVLFQKARVKWVVGNYMAYDTRCSTTPMHSPLRRVPGQRKHKVRFVAWSQSAFWIQAWRRYVVKTRSYQRTLILDLTGQVIKAWEIAIPAMKVGEVAEIICDYEYGMCCVFYQGSSISW